MTHIPSETQNNKMCQNLVAKVNNNYAGTYSDTKAHSNCSKYASTPSRLMAMNVASA